MPDPLSSKTCVPTFYRGNCGVVLDLPGAEDPDVDKMFLALEQVAVCRVIVVQLDRRDESTRGLADYSVRM